MKIGKHCFEAALVFCLLFAVGCASTPTQSSTGELIDDTVITAKVKTAIFNDDEISAAEINVETFKGVVQLSGFVSERSDVAKATTVAAAVSGVVSVKNDIVVK
jgi:osmotically-inducible protein OsmY